LDAVVWLGSHLWSALRGGLHVILNPLDTWNLADPEAVMRVIYYGASAELLLLFLLLAAGAFAVGLRRPGWLWQVVRGLEGVGNAVGRAAAWAGLLMVAQQIMVIFLQSIFRASDIGLLPVGIGFSLPVGWWGDSLKFHNATVVCLCCAYTFIQGCHVRVDLFYARAGFAAKRMIDMFGALFFMLPALLLMWFYSWFFLWRHLVTPKVSATDSLERMLAKTRAFRWQPETIGFSPNGFNGYFLFKLLLVLFCLTMLIQAVAFFYRSWLEFREGETSERRFHDSDVLTEHAPRKPRSAPDGTEAA